MSDEHNDPIGPPGKGDESRGAASVTLRTSEQDGDAGALLDRANKSALDALRIAYTIMTWIMIGLVVLFVLSGFQSVTESEKAVRLRFGKIDNSNLGAGFQFAFPPPIGELVKIQIGQQTLRIDDAFYPKLTEQEKSQTVAQLASRGSFRSYNPAEDGSLITADQNLAHAKWQVLYERANPTMWLTNIDKEAEEELVRLTVERAVVRAMAEITVDDLVKQSAGSEGSVARRAEQYSQEALDRLDSGIQIVRLDMIDPGPPINLVPDFAKVNSAETGANTERERALQDARTQLNSVAGGAATDLIELINRYERAADLGQSEQADTLLAAIQSVLVGEAVTVAPMSEDETEITVAEGSVSGQVTELISDAETYRRQVRDEAQADLARFHSKLEQYNQSRDVLVSREWADAVGEFLAKDTVQAMFLPTGTDVLELLLNRDPQILRDQEKADNRQRLIEANEKRLEELEKQKLSDVDQNSSG
ncbi:MAG: SPFH domain-containing protein [Phycisphaerales bacterium JB061]